MQQAFKMFRTVKQKAVENADFFVHLTGYVGVMYLFGDNVCTISICSGPSMLPTLQNWGDAVVIDTFSKKWLSKPYKVGEIVVATCPNDPNKQVCKRIAGVEHGVMMLETIDNGWVQRHTIHIPKGQVWLAGDNSSNSRDSRMYGPVPLGLIHGRVIARFSPFNWPPVSLFFNEAVEEEEEELLVTYDPVDGTAYSHTSSKIVRTDITDLAKVGLKNTIMGKTLQPQMSSFVSNAHPKQPAQQPVQLQQEKKQDEQQRQQ